MKKNIFYLLITIALIALASCAGSTTDQANQNTATPTNSQQTTDTLATDSNQVSTAQLTDIYIKAISQFIEAIKQKDDITFDTLFIGDRKLGSPDDFPNITLPQKIKNVSIVMLSIPEAHGPKMKFFKKNSPILNLMGWVDKQKAEFAFITFYPNFDHKYECYINYNFNVTKNEYELTKLSIEVLMFDKKGEPSHFAVYENGKFKGNKSLN